jgi:hypothetical protein
MFDFKVKYQAARPDSFKVLNLNALVNSCKLDNFRWSIIDIWYKLLPRRTILSIVKM